MKLAIVFEPDDSLGYDPLDDAKEARRLGIFIDSDKEDVILIHRRYGDQYEGGNRTDIYSSGIWENVTLDQMEAAIGHLEELEP